MLFFLCCKVRVLVADGTEYFSIPRHGTLCHSMQLCVTIRSCTHLYATVCHCVAQFAEKNIYIGSPMGLCSLSIPRDVRCKQMQTRTPYRASTSLAPVVRPGIRSSFPQRYTSPGPELSAWRAEASSSFLSLGSSLAQGETSLGRDNIPFKRCFAWPTADAQRGNRACVSFLEQAPGCHLYMEPYCLPLPWM